MMMMMMMGHPFGMCQLLLTQDVESESEPDFLVVSFVLIYCDHILLVLPVCMYESSLVLLVCSKMYVFLLP